MIGLRKDYYTMPSVENYYINDTILREPPKEYYSIKQDKVNQGGEITAWFGSDEYKDKLCDNILKYDKSSNLGVSVDYSFGTYKNDPKAGFAKSPYPIDREGNFRDPILTYMEKYPLNQTYNYYDDISVMAEPNYVKYMKEREKEPGVNELKKKLKKQKDIKLISKETKNTKFKSPYQNCVVPENIFDKYIVDRAEAIVQSRLKTISNKQMEQIDPSEYIKDLDYLIRVNTQITNANKRNNYYEILDDSFIKDQLDVSAISNKHGKSKKQDVNINDLELREILDAVAVNKKGRDKRTEVTTDELKLRELLDTVAFTQMKKSNVIQHNVSLTKEFKDKGPEVNIQTRETIKRKVVDNENLRDSVIDLKYKISDIPMKGPDTFKPRYERDEINTNTLEQDKANIYNSRV